MGRSLKIGTINMGASYILPIEVRNRVLEWQASHTDFFCNGPSVAEWNPTVFSSWYHTLGGMYSQAALGSQYRDFTQFCREHGWDYENALLHMKRDFLADKAWTTGSSTNDIGVFDVFEGANGVLTLTADGVFADRTKFAYQGKYTTTFDAALLVGYDLPFDQIRFGLRTPATLLEGMWQYWNGTEWVELPVCDETSLFTADGTVRFVPPANWERVSINGSWEKYFVRFVRNGGTAPVLTTIRGDDWLSAHEGFNCRGWYPESGTIINAGELAYNPNPPAWASAKFRHQSRVTGYWGSGILYGNRAYRVDGVSPFNEFKLAMALRRAAELPWARGVYLDSLGAGIGNGVKDPAHDPESFTDHFDWTTESYSDTYFAAYEEFVAKMREAIPGYRVGAGTAARRYALAGQWSLSEYGATPAGNGSIGQIKATTRVCYNDFVFEVNPEGKEWLLQFADTLDVRDGVPWDRANRSPLIALATHLIAQEYDGHVYLAYYSQGGWRYDNTDDIFLKNGSRVRMSDFADGEWPTIDNVYRWANYFPAMFVDYGQPDPNGWNGGVGAVWLPGNQWEYDGKTEVWRRDYTKAIILHRTCPSGSNLAPYYSVPCDPIPLGGWYREMRADGRLGPLIDRIALRAPESAILIPAADPVVFRGMTSTAHQATTETTFTLPMPEGTQGGDRLVVVASLSSGRTAYAPRGWQWLGAYKSQSKHLAVWTRVAAEGEQDATFQCSSSIARARAVLMAFGNAKDVTVNGAITTKYETVVECPSADVVKGGAAVISAQCNAAALSSVAATPELYDEASPVTGHLSVYLDQLVWAGPVTGRAITLSAKTVCSLATIIVEPY